MFEAVFHDDPAMRLEIDGLRPFLQLPWFNTLEESGRLVPAKNSLLSHDQPKLSDVSETTEGISTDCTGGEDYFSD